MPVELPVAAQVERLLADGVVVEANEALAHSFGLLAAGEMIGRGLGALAAQDDPRTREALAAFVRDGYRAGSAEAVEVDPRGRRRIGLHSVIGVVEGGALVECLGSRRDLTAERETLERLRERQAALELSERKFSLVFRANPGALALSRLSDSCFLDVNESFAELVGLPREQLIGRSALELGLWPDAEERRRAFAPVVERGFARRVPARVRAANGEIREARISGMALEIEGERCMLALAEDVTELNRAQSELTASEARFRAAAEGSLDAFWLLDAERDEGGRVTDFRVAGANSRAAALVALRQEPLLGRRLSELLPAAAARSLIERYRLVLDSGRAREDEVEMAPVGRSVRRFLEQVVPIEQAVAVWARDISERRAAEEERRRIEADFHRGQRFESLGLLAGGVAHDFNNLLTAILGSAEVAARHLPAGSEARAPLRDIAHAAERAAELTQKMLAFAGGGALAFAWISLNEVVEEMVELARSALPRGRDFRLQLARPSPGLEADPTQVRQVALNLLLNASEAIAGERGTLAVETAEVYCERERLDAAVLGAELPEGRFATLAVTDDGVGIAPEVRERIFEPFYTTKFTGRGLGLAAVLGIVRAHHGAIEVSSEPGRGTRVTVLLPLAQPR